MLQRYLRKVETILNSFYIDEHDKKTYLNALKNDIETQKKDTDIEADILANLKDPRVIVEELAMDYKRKQRIPFIDPLLKLIPLMLLTVYLAIGFTAQVWHPSWLLFLLWPLLVVLLESINDHEIHPLSSVTPLLLLFLFLALGIIYGLWHPAWALFFFMPVFPLINSRLSFEKKAVFYALLIPTIIIPVVIFTYYILKTIHPVWVLLLLAFLPLFIGERPTFKTIFGITLFCLGIIGYITVYMLWNLEESLYFITLLPLAFFIAKPKQETFKTLYQPTLMVLMMLSLLSFISLGIYLEAFTWAWVCFLIPLFYYHLSVKTMQKRPLSLSTFFLSISLFALLGGYYGYFHPAWLVFLLIPISKIIEAKHVKKT